MTAEKVRTNVYLDYNTKEKAKEIFKHYGVSLSDAINIFLTQTVLEKGMPFEMKIPNSETIKAINNARKNVDCEITSLEELEKEAKHCLQ